MKSYQPSAISFQDCRAGGSGLPGSPAVFGSRSAGQPDEDVRTTRPTFFNPKSKIQNPKSFTLIELLVVIAIIAVLVAMLLPALTKAREQARTTACGAQLKQVVNSLFLYAEDYGRFPNSHWYGFIQGNYVEFQWNNLVADAYLSKTKTVYLCPSDSTVNRAGNIGIWNISYGVSESGPCPPRDVIGSTPSGASAYRPVDVPNPNGTVLVSDSTEVLLPVDVVSPPAPAPPNNQLYRNVVSGIWDVRYFPSRRHSGSSNVGFCDGHLQYLSWDKLMPAIPGGVPLGDTLRYKLWFLLPLPVR